MDEFLKRLSDFYEIIIYTASLSKYADPLLDFLDKHRVSAFRLFREHCTFFNGIFVKDLSRLDRDLKDVIIIDNSPTSYIFHPENALPSISWYDDMSCTELYQMMPILEALARVDDVRTYLRAFVKENQILYAKAAQMLRGGKLQDRSHSQQHLEQARAPPEPSTAQQYFKNATIFKKKSEADKKQQVNAARYPATSNAIAAAAAKKKVLLNTWTPNGSGSHETTPIGGSPEFKYKHFSLLNQFNQAPTAYKTAYRTTNFQDTGAASDLSSQLLAIQNSIGGKGQRAHARTSAGHNKDRQHSAYARIGVAGALQSKPKSKAGGPTYAQIELANYKNMDPNRILNKENRQ